MSDGAQRLANNRPSYRACQWLVFAFASLHNLEEAVTFPRYLPAARRLLEDFAPALDVGAMATPARLYASLALATILPLGAVLWATRSPADSPAGRLVVLVQAMFLVNVVLPHVPAAVALRGYTPGVATAVLINLPYSIYFLSRSVDAGALRREHVPAAVGLAAVGLVVSLPLLLLAAGAFL